MTAEGPVLKRSLFLVGDAMPEVGLVSHDDREVRQLPRRDLTLECRYLSHIGICLPEPTVLHPQVLDRVREALAERFPGVGELTNRGFNVAVRTMGSNNDEALADSDELVERLLAVVAVGRSALVFQRLYDGESESLVLNYERDEDLAWA